MTRQLALVGVLLAAACSGPKPVIESVAVTPVGAGIVRVTVVARNTGRGEGEGVIELTLRDRATGEVVGRDEIDVDLRARERVTVSRDLPIPRADRAVVAEAEARYPP